MDLEFLCHPVPVGRDQGLLLTKNETLILAGRDSNNIVYDNQLTRCAN